MLLWTIIALLTAAAVAAIVRPILAQSHAGAPTSDAAPRHSPDIDVYRDQLAEIDRDLGRGLMDAGEAEAARREVARRLIAHAPASGRADTAEPPISTAPHQTRVRLAAVVLAAIVPIAAVSLYVMLGAPGMPALPHAQRVAAPPERSPVEDLIGRVEARLRTHPDDGAGWDVIAPVYMRLNRFADAAEAYARAGRLLGETPDRLLGVAEATVLAANGVVTPPARLAFQKMQTLAPERPEPRFWLAHALEQDGNLAGAIAAYRALVASAPADAPWLAGVRERLAEVTARLATGGAPSASLSPSPSSKAGQAAPSAGPSIARGPTAEDVKAAGAMAPADRMRMIEGMVDGLAARLKENGKDPDGWMKLLRAYKVLGRDGAAATALVDARKALTGDAKALGEIDALARSLGIGAS